MYSECLEKVLMVIIGSFGGISFRSMIYIALDVIMCALRSLCLSLDEKPEDVRCRMRGVAQWTYLGSMPLPLSGGQAQAPDCPFHTFEIICPYLQVVFLLGHPGMQLSTKRNEIKH